MTKSIFTKTHVPDLYERNIVLVGDLVVVLVHVDVFDRVHLVVRFPLHHTQPLIKPHHQPLEAPLVVHSGQEWPGVVSNDQEWSEMARTPWNWGWVCFNDKIKKLEDLKKDNEDLKDKLHESNSNKYSQIGPGFVMNGETLSLSSRKTSDSKKATYVNQIFRILHNTESLANNSSFF